MIRRHRASVVLVGVAAICLFAVIALRKERRLIATTFVGYTGVGDDRMPAARLTLSNGLSRVVRFYRNSGSGFARCMFSDLQGSAWTNWIAEHNFRGVHSVYVLQPGEVEEVLAELRLDGGQRRFGIFCVEERRRLPGPLANARSWLDGHGWWPNPRVHTVWNEEPLSSPLIERTNAPPPGSDAPDRP